MHVFVYICEYTLWWHMYVIAPVVDHKHILQHMYDVYYIRIIYHV